MEIERPESRQPDEENSIKADREKWEEASRRAWEVIKRALRRREMKEYLRESIVRLRESKGLPNTATWEEIIEADREGWEKIREEFNRKYSDVDEETRIEIIADVLGEFTKSMFSEEARRKLLEYILNPKENQPEESSEESQNE
ncbi:MAG: hypothetical protein ACO2OW_01175 [Minisyncoccia bacterium]|jgi:hypothetical protein